MNALVVGAGAVGQVYARELQRGGAQVTFLVRRTHAVSKTLAVLPQVKAPEPLQPFEVVSEVPAGARYAQVWLTVPTDALEGAWLPKLVAETGDATIVCLAPEAGTVVPPERMVLGSIPFIAWHSPLPGASTPEGTAVWWPPFASVPFSGPSARVKAVREVLERGGRRTKTVPDVAKSLAPLTALLLGMVAALEAAGWRFRDFNGAWAKAGAQASRDILRIVGAPSYVAPVARGWLFSLVLWAGQRVLPFDFETYLRVHFTKVGPQTRLLYDRWIADGRKRGLPVGALEKLAPHFNRSKSGTDSAGSDGELRPRS